MQNNSINNNPQGNQMQNNFINNKHQGNQLIQQNLGNNQQINQNIPNYGFQWNMNFLPNQNFNNNNNLFLMNKFFPNNFQQPNQIFNQNQNQIFNQNQNNQIQNPKEIEPISLYEKPTLIGLTNIGSTCFKNSVLQCLSQTKGLTNFFLNQNNYNAIMNTNTYKQNQIKLCPIYYNLIKNLWNKNSTSPSFSPREFMTSIAEMTKNESTNFSLNKAGDAKDFILYILQTMHKELKKPFQEKDKFWTNMIKNQPRNQYDKGNTMLYFFDDFCSDASIITKLFHGVKETNSKRLNEPISYNYEIFSFLYFPLEMVRQFVQQNNINNLNVGTSSNPLTINDCLNFEQRNNYNIGSNQIYCNICNQLSDSISTTKIYSTSHYLIMLLNIGVGKVYDVKLKFSSQIDISNYVKLKEEKQIFNLYGVITHIGESGDSGHFVASCKSPVDNQWYQYNDAFVNPIKDLEKEVFNFATPYILFYEKEK